MQKARNGGTPGRAPLGYLNVRHIENGRELRTVEIDPERAPLIAWAFEAYATGNWTVRKLVAELNDRGLTTLTTAARPSKPLSDSQLHNILRHPYYTGVVRYRGAIYPGKHDPLVDIQTWQRVQELLTAKTWQARSTASTPTTSRAPSTAGTAAAASSSATQRDAAAPTPTSSASVAKETGTAAPSALYGSRSSKKPSPATTQPFSSQSTRSPHSAHSSKANSKT